MNRISEFQAVFCPPGWAEFSACRIIRKGITLTSRIEVTRTVKSVLFSQNLDFELPDIQYQVCNVVHSSGFQKQLVIFSIELVSMWKSCNINE